MRSAFRRSIETCVSRTWIIGLAFGLSQLCNAQSNTFPETHIKTHKHLPGIPSAAKVAEQGVSLGEMQVRLLAKIEELTLHLIGQQKTLQAQQEEIVALRAEVARLSTQK